MRRILLAIAAGALLWLSLPGPALWWCAPLGVALLALVTRGRSVAVGAGLGYLAGFAYFALTLRWAGIYVGPVPWLALAALQAAYVAVVGAVCAGLQRGWTVGGPTRIRPLVVALAWVGSEALRSRTPYGGFPWSRLAFGQADSPFGHIASLGGAPMVTFVVALTGGVLASAFVRGPGLGLVSRPSRRRVAAAGGLVLVGLLVPIGGSGAPLAVMGVQGNVPKPGLDFNSERAAVLRNHVEATTRAAQEVRDGQRAAPDLVVWPENASDIDPVVNLGAGELVQGAVDAVDAPTLIGTLSYPPGGPLQNVALLYEPGTGVSFRYAKQHPVPFAEFIPNREFFRALSPQVDLVRVDMVAGSDPGVFAIDTRAGERVTLGTSICFEVAYDDLVADQVRRGAQVLVVQTNNATFGFTDESEQQLAISRLRAIEHGRSVVHVSTVGVSALVRPDGSTMMQTELFTQAVIDGVVPMRSELTWATRLGAWPEWLSLVALAGLVAAGIRTHRRSLALVTPPGRTP